MSKSSGSSAPDQPVVMKRYSTQGRTFSAKDLEHLATLSALPDDQIDFSDSPELTPEQAKLGFRPGLSRPIKLPVTIRLDADVVSWFKDHADGKPYQSEINRALRQHMINAGKKSA